MSITAAINAAVPAAAAEAIRCTACGSRPGRRCGTGGGSPTHLGMHLVRIKDHREEVRMAAYLTQWARRERAAVLAGADSTVEDVEALLLTREQALLDLVRWDLDVALACETAYVESLTAA